MFLGFLFFFPSLALLSFAVVFFVVVLVTAVNHILQLRSHPARGVASASFASWHARKTELLSQKRMVGIGWVRSEHCLHLHQLLHGRAASRHSRSCTPAKSRHAHPAHGHTAWRPEPR
jgi:hypothetical protein